MAPSHGGPISTHSRRSRSRKLNRYRRSLPTIDFDVTMDHSTTRTRLSILFVSLLQMYCKFARVEIRILNEGAIVTDDRMDARMCMRLPRQAAQRPVLFRICKIHRHKRDVALAKSVCHCLSPIQRVRHRVRDLYLFSLLFLLELFIGFTISSFIPFVFGRCLIEELERRSHSGGKKIDRCIYLLVGCMFLRSSRAASPLSMV